MLCLQKSPKENILVSAPLVKFVICYKLTAAVLAQSVERVTAEREVEGSIPGVGPILRVLK